MIVNVTVLEAVSGTVSVNTSPTKYPLPGVVAVTAPTVVLPLVTTVNLAPLPVPVAPVIDLIDVTGVAPRRTVLLLSH